MVRADHDSDRVDLEDTHPGRPNQVVVVRVPAGRVQRCDELGV